MDDINKQIAKAQRNAKAKMKRINKSQRLSVEKTKFNPIVSNVKSMTPPQKRNYLKKLNNFNDRKFQLYRTGNNTIITSDEWNKYKAAEAEANKFISSDMKKYSKLKGPFGDLTLGQYLKILRPGAGKLMVNPSGSGMYIMNRMPTAIGGKSSLEKLTNAQLDKVKSGYMSKKLREGRSQFKKMADATGDEELISKANSLTDEQFKVLWNYTDFATQISLKYEILQQELKAGKQKPYHGAIDTADARMREYLEWAGQI